MRFTCSSASKAVLSGRIWVPAAGVPATFLWQLWRLTGGSTLLASVDVAALSPALGAWAAVPITAHVPLATATTYAVRVFCSGGTDRYVRSNGMTFPVGSGGSISCDRSLEDNDISSSTAPSTLSSSDRFFFADVEVGVSGAGTATVGALTGTSTGLRKVFGTAAATVGEMTGLATGLRKVYGSGFATVGAISGTGLVPAAAQVTGSGWGGLLSILQEGRDLYAQQKNAPPVACPNDGEPLQAGPNGELHCRFDGYIAGRGW